jgi:tagatose-1,6-bisphosphate aldolase
MTNEEIKTTKLEITKLLTELADSIGDTLHSVSRAAQALNKCLTCLKSIDALGFENNEEEKH